MATVYDAANSPKTQGASFCQQSAMIIVPRLRRSDRTCFDSTPMVVDAAAFPFDVGLRNFGQTESLGDGGSDRSLVSQFSLDESCYPHVIEFAYNAG